MEPGKRCFSHRVGDSFSFQSRGHTHETTRLLDQRGDRWCDDRAAIAVNCGPRAGETAKAATKWRGVNLGGWLVLEKWITPSVYAGVQAEDEYTLCQTLGKAKAAERLKRHRETWITDGDFDWLKARGINAVRIPVNYGVAEENPPFITGMDTLDWAFRTAKKHGIGVLLDLHGVPGSQNAWDHSGRQGTLGWHTSKENIDHSLRIVGDLASRCKGYDNLIGFELVNEPRYDVPLDIIKRFYQDAYQRVREHHLRRRAPW